MIRQKVAIRPWLKSQDALFCLSKIQRAKFEEATISASVFVGQLSIISMLQIII
jgi:hypothetical protein